MFDRYIRIFGFVQLCLLIVLLIKSDIIFALQNPDVVDLNNKDRNANTLPTASDKAWMKIKMNPGKDKLNAHHLRNTRGNIIKSVLTIVGGVLILFIIGGIISVIVYYVKKK